MSKLFDKFKHKASPDPTPETDLSNPEKALQDLLFTMSKSLGTENIVEYNHIFCPKYDLTITPQIEQLSPQSAILNFYSYAPQWGKELFECSVGMAKDTHTAIGMASGSFLFSFMDVIHKAESNDEQYITERFTTEFADRRHNWKVYLSDIVGMGESPQVDSPTVYWNALKDEIIKRLGNQKLCYVKIYLAKSYGEITGECRIDDIKSEELSDMVAKLAESWDVATFASHKMFCFIKQVEETVSPYPYFGTKGRALFKSKLKTAVDLFRKADTEEKYNRLPADLKAALDDDTLADECYSFLPEICAENAFTQVIFPEIVEISIGSRRTVKCYKNQLADYYTLCSVLLELFDEGVFGSKTNEIYRQYINVSAIGSCLSQVLEKGSQLEGSRMAALLFQVDDDFELR